MVQNWYTGTLWRTIDVIDKDACWNYKVENKWRLFFIGCLFELEIFIEKGYDNAEHLTTFLKTLSHVASSDVTWRHMTLICHKGLYILLTCAKCRRIHPISYYLSESIWTDNSNEGSYMPVRVLVVPLWSFQHWNKVYFSRKSEISYKSWKKWKGHCFFKNAAITFIFGHKFIYYKINILKMTGQNLGSLWLHSRFSPKSRIWA